MRTHFFLITWILLVGNYAHAQPKLSLPTSFKGPIAEEVKPFFPASEGQLTEMLKGEVISEGNVTSPTDIEQQLMLFVAGVHPRNCTRAMRKLSLYENYHSHMDFIKESKYDDVNQRVAFTIDHTLLPFPMLVRFKIPRITKAGHYPFLFEDGFLKNLKGTVIVKEVGKFCLLSLKTDWRGPESKIPNSIFGTFLQTVGKIGLEHLIRVSLF